MCGRIRPSEAFLETWGRRLITIPLYTLLWLFGLIASPVLLGVAALVDAIRRRRWATVRCLSFFVFYLSCEVTGIAASFIVWLTSALPGTRDRQRFLARNFALQSWWARSLLSGAQRIFGMRVAVEGAEAAGHGPMILFIRHASVGDTLLPAVHVGARHGIELRYVMKHELLWDPCLDIVGNRLPNCFVRRGSADGEREIAAIRQLMHNLGPRDGVLIYPEGTRFTVAKQKRVLQRLAGKNDPDLVARATALRHVLPPHLGGALALLESDAAADVVFCAHVGFEGAGSFRDLLNGSLVERTVHVGFWRIPCAAVPRERGTQARWLYDQWAQVDEWIGQHLETAG